MSQTSILLERTNRDSVAPTGSASRLGPLLVFAVACICAVVICASSWPGYMSFDSLETLRQARFGITTNGYPTIGVYMQRLFDAILPGPGLLFAFQVGLYLLSTAAILVRLRLNTSLAVATVLFLSFSPAIVGLLLVVWKDIGMTGFLVFSIACALQVRHTGSRIWLGLAIFGLFMATAYRLNGICAAVPLLMWTVASYVKSDKKRLAAWVISSLAAITIGTVVLNKFRLPDFRPLNSHIEAILYTFDLIGLSERTKRNLIPSAFIEQYSNFTRSDVRGVYFIPHGGRSWYADPNEPNRKIISPLAITAIQSGDGVITRIDGSKYSIKQLHDDWLHAVLGNPRAYIKHRYDVDRAFLGIGAAVPWGITYPRIDPNDLGVSHRDNALTKITNKWLLATQETIFAFPWFYYVLGIATGICAWCLKPKERSLCIALLASAFLLLLPMLFITASSEQRYHLWSMVAIVLAAVSLAAPFGAKQVYVQDRGNA